jgi:hypothetical protein
MERETLYMILFFSFPMIIGAVVTLAKIEKVVSWIDAFNAWVARKRARAIEKGGRINKYFIRPLLWGLVKIMGWTEQIDNKFLRTGVRVTSYLYFTAIMLYLAFIATIVIAIIILTVLAIWLALWIIGGILSEGESMSTKSTVKYAKEVNKGRLGDNIFPFGGTRLDHLQEKFGNERIELRNNGEIYTEEAFGKKIGYIDDDGTVYDTRGLSKKVGRVDEDGRVHDY